MTKQSFCFCTSDVTFEARTYLQPTPGSAELSRGIFEVDVATRVSVNISVSVILITVEQSSNVCQNFCQTQRLSDTVLASLE
jgi:hypothetical protein